MITIMIGRFFVLSFALAVCVLSAHAQTLPAGTKPVSAAVVNLDPTIEDWQVGDIEVTFANGTKEIVTHDRRCARPLVSKHGDVGWSAWMDAPNTQHHGGEILRLERRDGTMADFHPNNRFIMGWNFVKNDSALSIASMGFHGSQVYIEYDIKTGKVLHSVDEYLPYDQLPAWAQPLSDEKP